jgi:hypothetical protein
VSRIIVVAVLLVVAFLAGFLPQYAKGKRLERELGVARQENALAQLRDMAGLAFLQASQKDYGLAAGTSTSFFDRTRAAAYQTPDSNLRKSLEDLLNLRDQITGGVARGDPGVLNDLQTLWVKTREATAASARQPE